METSAASNTQQNDFKVADLSLAPWGFKEIAIAKTEMPGLMTLIEELGAEQAFKGCSYCRLFAYDNTNSSFNRDPCGSWSNYKMVFV